ncbi:hypothetical protein ACIPSE_09615 [Streptomyces sp. NPDC090106]|uniref:hypothetical protein n=1 Tax=Streptomyces sp. NPDC090106 TaxID=3365946 RepID=UPI003812343C
MRALTTRPRRLAVALAALSAAALGTVSASAAQSPSPSPSSTGSGSGGGHPGRGGSALAVSYEPTGNAPDDVNAVNDDFAACMSRYGVATVPVFHATKDADGRVTLRVQGGAEKEGTAPSPKKFRKALKHCAPILEEVGLTLSTDASGLPPLQAPGHGHDDGGPGTSSGKEDSGAPSLSKHA